MRPPLLDRREHGARVPAFEHESQRAANLRGASALAEQEQRGVGVARELGEPHADGAGQHRCAIEHDEGKGAGPEQEIGAPGRARGFTWPHHPKRIAPSGIHGHPVAGVEGAGGIYPGDRVPTGERGGGEGAGECGFAESGRGEELSDAPSRESTPRKGGIEGGESGGEPRGSARRSGDDGRELLAQVLKGGEGHL
jgi:hypothetical protein